MAERLLDHDPRGSRQPGVRQPLDDRREQKRWDLQIEDRRSRALDRLTHTLVGGRVGKVALDIREAPSEPLEDLRVELLTGADDRLARSLDQPVDRPIVHRHTHDRAREQAALLQSVQRPERHHPRQIAGDPEHHQDIGRLLATPLPGAPWSRGCDGVCHFILL